VSSIAEICGAIVPDLPGSGCREHGTLRLSVAVIGLPRLAPFVPARCDASFAASEREQRQPAQHAGEHQVTES
jgi:hypothetical protein